MNEKLLKYFSDMEKLEMYCPICKEKLEFKEWSRYLDELGNNSNTVFYNCVNKECQLSINESCWDSNGDFYSGNLPFKDTNRLFPNNEYGAYNSITKKHEVEIYKIGLKKKTYFHPIFCLFLLKPYIEHNYKSDYWGRIIKKSYKLKFLKYSKSFKTYSIGYISGVNMLLFTLKSFKRDLKKYHKNNNKYIVKELSDSYINNDKRWWKIASRHIFNMFYRKEKQQIFKHKKIWDILSDDDVLALINYYDINKDILFSALEKYDEKKLKDIKFAAHEIKHNKNIIRKKKLDILNKKFNI